MTVYKKYISAAGDETTPICEQLPKRDPLSVHDLEQIFTQTFGSRYQTRLLGGASEPVYLPGQLSNFVQDDVPSAASTRQQKVNHQGQQQQHCIYYREDYFSSALHEVAHWCIAGPARRRQTDYGYWYSPDGRGLVQQHAFEAAEQKPQALEWIFSIICGARFAVSIDNLNRSELATDPEKFSRSVQRAALGFCTNGLPARACQFTIALNRFYCIAQPAQLLPFVRDALLADASLAATVTAPTVSKNAPARCTHV